MLDDVLNGNTSTGGKYFLGINGLTNSLNNLKINMTNV
jgi:hypothetical protein